LTDDPTRLLETLGKRRKAGLRFCIVRREPHQHTDATHPFALLRARRERPRRRRTSEKRNELAPPHLSPRDSPARHDLARHVLQRR
jgi:hypothetical protein